MRQWRKLLGGLLLWTMHFFAVYFIGSIFPGTKIAAFLVVGVSIALIAVTIFLGVRSLRQYLAGTDGLDRWMVGLSSAGYAIAGIAILYQAMPAILI